MARGTHGRLQAMWEPWGLQQSAGDWLPWPSQLSGGVAGPTCQPPPGKSPKALLPNQVQASVPGVLGASLRVLGRKEMTYALIHGLCLTMRPDHKTGKPLHATNKVDSSFLMFTSGLKRVNRQESCVVGQRVKLWPVRPPAGTGA